MLQRNNIHIAVYEPDKTGGSVGASLKALRASPVTTKAKAKFILATDGQTLEAEALVSAGLAGISTIKEIKDNPVDVRATGRLNKLYVELLARTRTGPRTSAAPT